MSNGLVFRTDVPTELASLIEVGVRRDVGSARQLGYSFAVAPGEVSAEEGRATDVRQGLGLGWTSIGTICVRLPWPRTATLTGDVVRFGLVSYLGPLRYEIEVDRGVDADVTFEARKRDGGPTFLGGNAAASLNGLPGFAKRVATVLRPEFFTGTIWVKGAGCGLTVVGTDAGSTLQLSTYGRLTDVLGMHATTDAGEVLQIAEVIGRTISDP